MTHPFTILETYGTDTGWNDNSMLAIVCDFVHVQAIRGPDLLVSFRQYLIERAEEEAENATCILTPENIHTVDDCTMHDHETPEG